MDERRYARFDSLVQCRLGGNSCSWQGFDEGLEAGGDFGGRSVWREGDRSADVDGEFADMG